MHAPIKAADDAVISYLFMTNFDSKTLLACKLVKGDIKLADLICRTDKNIANIATLSNKALKQIQKMQDEKAFSKVDSAYASLAVYALKMEQCRDI